MLALAAGVCSVAQNANPPAGTSSVTTFINQLKTQTHRSVHHIQVPDEDSPSQPAELTQAEAAIEKKDYAAAELLLRKLVDHDPASYVAWFDLGFVENALGKVGRFDRGLSQVSCGKARCFRIKPESWTATGQDRPARCGRVSAGCDASEAHQSSCRGSVPGLVVTGADD